MEPTTVLLLMALLIGGAAFAAPFVFITLAAFIYFWVHSYPWLKMVGKWAAKPANFIALMTIFMMIFLFIIIMATLIHPLLFILLLPALLILFPLDLAIIVWQIRLIKWFFGRLSGWIDGIFLAARLEFIKLKIKTDMMKGGGGKGKLGVLRGEFAGDAKKVTDRVSGKKAGGFRGKLQALKGEFSSDVEKTRGKIFRRK